MKIFNLNHLCIIASIAASSAYANSDYGNCDNVFVNKKPPEVKGVDITPLCEENEKTADIYFATGYSKDDNHGIWSAYMIDYDMAVQLNEDPLPRPSSHFRQNPKLDSWTYTQPIHDSYTGLGWDRGHLAPNGAMAWNEDAQLASFYVSNIAPQNPGMNRNIWRCFEYSIREWAEESEITYVVVGAPGQQDKPLVSDRTSRNVPITIPESYIAMVYRVIGNNHPDIAIGVRVPNTAGHLDIRDYIMSVDDLEHQTGFNFNIPAVVANQKPDPSQWPTRLVKRELLGKLPSIDDQCPKIE